MRWEGGRRSGNVEDRRGLRLTRGIAGGGLGTIVLVLVALYFGVDPSVILNTAQTGGGTSVEQSNEPRPPAENALADFTSVVLADTEDAWGAIFRAKGLRGADAGVVHRRRRIRVRDGQRRDRPVYCRPTSST
jgi:predicted metalloprotease